jgi:hypothetical protein
MGIHSNIFSKIFGTSSLEVTTKLLHNTLKRVTDYDIRKEPTKGLRAFKTCSD